MESNSAGLTGAEIMHRLEVELRPLLLTWDPLGVGPGCPPDEYDGYFGRVLQALRSHPSEEALTEWVMAFTDWDLDADSASARHHSREIAAALMDWWAEAQEWMPKGVADE